MKPQLLWALLAMFVAAAVVQRAPPATQLASPALVDVVDDGKPIDLWLAQQGDSLVGDIGISFINRGDQPTTVVAYIVASTAGASPAITVKAIPEALPPRRPLTTRLSVSIAGSDLPASASLVLRADAGAQSTFLSTRPIHAAFKDSLVLRLGLIAISVLAIVTMLVGFCSRRDKDKIKWDSHMGGPEWDFKSSWASNITIIGAVITTVLSFSGLPDVTKHLSRATYESISLLWTLVITLSPAIYNFLRRQTLDLNATLQANASPIYHGLVIGFLLASGFTLWAVFGQLGTLAFLLDELRPVHLLPDLGVYLFWVLLFAISCGLCYYGFASVVDTLAQLSVANDERPRTKTHIDNKVASLDRATTPRVAYDRLASAMKRPVWHPL